MWLARLSDKARASAAGTIHDYIYPCGMDQGVLERWTISVKTFERALEQHGNDATLHAWLTSTATTEQIEAANVWLETDKTENLNRQDAEEGHGGSH